MASTARRGQRSKLTTPPLPLSRSDPRPPLRRPWTGAEPAVVAATTIRQGLGSASRAASCAGPTEGFSPHFL